MQKTCRENVNTRLLLDKQSKAATSKYPLLLLCQHVPNNASPFTKMYKETSTRIADMNAIWCKALVFDLCITSSISRIWFSSFNMTTPSCSSCSPETLSLRTRSDLNGREDALPHAAQDLPFVDAQLRRALRQIKHRHIGTGNAIDALRLSSRAVRRVADMKSECQTVEPVWYKFMWHITLHHAASHKFSAIRTSFCSGVFRVGGL